MLKLLDLIYASTRPTTIISVLTALYLKRVDGKASMPKYFDEFESLFAQF